MPTYTVLGGTGSTGSAVIRALITNPPANLSLKIYVRSKPKLLALIPFLTKNPNTTIIEGSFTDQSTLSKCLQDSDAIFSCIAVSYSEPGMNIAVGTAAGIISSLQSIRSSNKSSYKTPTIIMISSASVNPSLLGAPPKPLRSILMTALHYHYSDLAKAQQLYRDTIANDSELLIPIFAQPPAIMPGEIPTGYTLSTVGSSPTVSFADLGVAMVEMAERKEEFKGMGVTVVATGKVEQNWGPNFKSLISGLFAYFLPGIWRVGWERGWW